MAFRSRSLAGALVALVVASPAAAQWFTGMGSTAGGLLDIRPIAVSNNGVVAANLSSGARGLVWTRAGGFQFLPMVARTALDITADGTTVLVRGTTPQFNAAANYLWSESAGLVDVGFTDHVFDMSEDGSTLVGRTINNGHSEAYRWRAAAGMELLGTLVHTNPQSDATGVSADGSVIAGESRNNLGAEGFLYTDATGMQPFGSATVQNVDGISGDGQTVFGRDYLWTEAVGYSLIGNTFNPTVPKFLSSVSGNGALAVGGNAFSSVTTSAAFIWDYANGMQELSAYLQDDLGLDVSGWTLLHAVISPSGLYIAGSAINPDGDREGFAVYRGNPFGSVLCGLGPELALLLPLLAGLRSRRRPR